MNVLYDISVLGAGYDDPLARTGIFRTVENLAFQLASSLDCALTLCASRNLGLALEYYLENPNLHRASFPVSNIGGFSRNVNRRIRALNSTIAQKGHWNFDLLAAKLSRRAWQHIKRFTESEITNISAEILSDVQIFHSPFHPLPARVKRDRRIKKFITIYDLIPILFPHLFKSQETNLAHSILAQLDSKHFIFCISQSTKNDLCNHLKYLSPNSVFVTHLAASKLFYPCADSQEISMVQSKYDIPSMPYFLSLSTLEPRKNIPHVIRSFAKLIHEEKIENLSLVLVGAKGWQYNEIFETASAYEAIKDRIIFTGYVADKDLAPLYSGALAFVYPSLYEGFGLPPLEAMQCGVPVITSNNSALPEVVGEAGIMLDHNDLDGLCQSLLDIYNHPSLRESMSRKSIDRAKQFSWEKCARETVAAYRSVLEN